MSMDSVTTVVNALKPFAEKLGQGAEALYKIYVKQQIATGVAEIIWALFMIGIAVAIYKGARKLLTIAKKMQDSQTGWADDRGDGYFFGSITLIAGAVVLSVAGVGVMTDGAQKLVNPQYYAIRSIACTVTKCNNN